eukprot:TRINITY_DN70_c0_g1_i1.p1 TRINITY_DN70_c0_g1~~TRINITY_DN70_c0_g1_i1.p1  ORF type:complete len:104 (-),score=23.91 TRINITY_DN70_c0_g1_i1:333-644(-)
MQYGATWHRNIMLLVANNLASPSNTSDKKRVEMFKLLKKDITQTMLNEIAEKNRRNWLEFCKNVCGVSDQMYANARAYLPKPVYRKKSYNNNYRGWKRWRRRW